MAHSIGVFAPTTNRHQTLDTPINVSALFYVPLLGILNAGLWGFGIIGIVTVFIPIVVAFIIYTIGLSHEEKPLSLRGRKLWRKYLSLDSDLRSRVPLTIDSILKISESPEQLDELFTAINGLIITHERRKELELALDPTLSILLDSIKRTAEEEYDLSVEIRKISAQMKLN